MAEYSLPYSFHIVQILKRTVNFQQCTAKCFLLVSNSFLLAPPVPQGNNLLRDHTLKDRNCSIGILLQMDNLKPDVKLAQLKYLSNLFRMVGEDKFLFCFGRGNIYLWEKLLLTYFCSFKIWLLGRWGLQTVTTYGKQKLVWIISQNWIQE